MREWPEKWTPAHASKTAFRQSVAGIVVGEKNRCISNGLRPRGTSPFGANLQRLAGTISGTIEGHSAGA
jgi:hypothetical protein